MGVPKHRVASPTEQRSDFAACVAMVDMKSSRANTGFVGLADRAASVLGLQHVLVLSCLQAVRALELAGIATFRVCSRPLAIVARVFFGIAVLVLGSARGRNGAGLAIVLQFVGRAAVRAELSFRLYVFATTALLETFWRAPFRWLRPVARFGVSDLADLAVARQAVGARRVGVELDFGLFGLACGTGFHNRRSLVGVG